MWFAETLTTLAAVIVVGLLTTYSFNHFLRAWNNGDSTIDINLPVWPSKLMVSVALGFLLLRLIVQLLGYLRLLRSPTLTPVAVPLIANIVEAAQHEIETGMGPASRRTHEENS